MDMKELHEIFEKAKRVINAYNYLINAIIEFSDLIPDSNKELKFALWKIIAKANELNR